MFIRSSAGAQRLERLARPNRTTHQEEVR